MEKNITKLEDFITGEIYHQLESNIYEHIFRATVDLYKCNAIEYSEQSQEFYYNFLDYDDFNINPTRKATQEERLWFEYCESICEYRTKEEALDHMYTKQFVEQYLTEE